MQMEYIGKARRGSGKKASRKASKSRQGVKGMTTVSSYPILNTEVDSCNSLDISKRQVRGCSRNCVRRSFTTKIFLIIIFAVSVCLRVVESSGTVPA
jgi:hypothetical protein